MSVLMLPKFDLKNPEKPFIGCTWVESSSSEMIDVSADIAQDRGEGI